jgi:hypothetical protein
MRISRQSFPLPIVIDQKQLEKWNIFSCFGSLITNYAGCMRVNQIKDCSGKSSIQQEESFHQQTGPKTKEETN